MINLNAIISKREMDVVEQIALGRDEAEAADELCISIHTVRNHKRNAYHKLGIQKATEAAVWYFCKRFKIPISMCETKRRIVALSLLCLFVYDLAAESHHEYRRSRIRRFKIEEVKTRRKND